jgi:hypothetical protein
MRRRLRRSHEHHDHDAAWRRARPLQLLHAAGLAASGVRPAAGRFRRRPVRDERGRRHRPYHSATERQMAAIADRRRTSALPRGRARARLAVHAETKRLRHAAVEVRRSISCVRRAPALQP